MEHLPLPDDPDVAVDVLLQTSESRPVLLFKKSPNCPASHDAERELREWLKDLPEDRPLAVAEVDVIARRSLARGITRLLDVTHESPQALVFHGAALTWHASHDALTREAFQEQVFGDPIW